MAGPGADTAALSVLIAPDSFGDSLTAVEAAEAIAVGWRRGRPGDELTLAPQSDGGPGFVAVLAGRLGELRTARISGPLTEPVWADWVFDPREPPTAYLESAQACGLALLGGPPTPRTAVAAHSRGVGELIAAALTAGARRIVVGLGGSGCTDGGRGMVEALADPDPAEAPSASLAAARARLAGVELIAATDVEHPLLGPMGAARVFGPQKGADPATVEVLERRLTDWAVHLPGVADLAGAGAAGGLGAALLALGARRESGATVIADHTGLAADLAAADLVITGEGRFDEQSLHGKVISALAGRARQRGVPVLVLAGQLRLDRAALRGSGVAGAFSVAEHAGSVRLAIEDAAHQLAALAERTAAEFTANPAALSRSSDPARRTEE